MKKMKKTISLILCVLMLLSGVPAFAFAAQEPERAKQYNLVIEADGRTTHWEDEDGNTVELSTAKASSKKKARAAAAVLPEKYDSREHGFVTSVKAQGSYGNCWAFAATSCVESALIKKGLADNKIDLSEDHLSWFAKNSLVNSADDTTSGDGYSYSDTYTAYNVGGTWMDSISTYARGSGPVYDKDYPYPTGMWGESERYNAQFRVTDCSTINISDVSKIKNAIMQYGSVKTSYYSHTGYYNVTENGGSAYYDPDTNGSTNHDVTIVGWDDNYAVENFNVEYRPSRKGAWLVKNSWGKSSPLLEDGYFWMSYDEKEVLNVSYYDADEKSIYDNTYQYDGIGSYSALYYPGYSSAYGANVFTAKSHETLNYVGFYSEADVHYTVYIYKLSKKTDYPTSGTLVSTTSGSKDYYGYHTAKLETPVEVNPGDVFSAVLQISMYSGANAKIMTEGTMYDASFNDYESYFGTDKQFMDMISPSTGYFKTAGNVCLKVMSKNISDCNHNYTSVYTAPTCTIRGGTTYTCTLCGDSYMTDIVAPTGHTEVTDDAVEPTCTKSGLTEGSHCSVCQTVFTQQKEIPATGHNWVGTVIKQPTCTQPGQVSNAVCSVCGEAYSGTISVPATGHTVVEDPATEPTCTDPGYSAGTHCSVCNTILSGHYIKWATGHNEISVAAEKATCTKDGHTAGTKCSVCNAVLSGLTVITATGHKFGEWEDLEDGGKRRVCSVCGFIETQEAEGCKHTIVIDPAVEATCTQSGLTEGSHCSKCGEVIKAQEKINALGHTVVIDNAKKATCTESGLTEGSHCSVCKVIIKAQETILATGHTYGAWETEQEATCTQNGILKKVCSSCGNVFRSMQSKKNHVYVIDSAVEATCTKDGLTEGMHCSSCGLVITAQTVIKATGHKYESPVVTREATCSKEGIETQTCSSCGDVQTKTLPKTAHTIVIDTGKKATCTEEGLTEGSHCSVCGEVLTKQEVIEALDHSPAVDEAVAPTCTKSGLSMGSHCSVCGEVLLEQEFIPALGHSYGNPITTKEATCTEEGLATRTCSSCGDKQTQVIEKTEHKASAWIVDAEANCVNGGTKHKECTVCQTVLETQKIPATGSHTYKDTVTPPSCTAEGYTVHTCPVCGSSYTDSIVPSTGHKYGDPITTKEATCTEEGLAAITCSFCGDKQTQVIEKTEHKASAWIVDAEANCVNGGTKHKECTVCKTVLETQEIPATGSHTYKDAVTPPACTTEGYTVHTCSVCGSSYTDSIVPAIGHKMGAWVQTKDPTCTEDGEQTRNCTVCGFSQTKVTSKLPHSDNDNDGYCDDCKQEIGTDPSKNCSCLCHSKNGLLAFFWKIKLIFIKLFSTQQTCACGIKHY